MVVYREMLEAEHGDWRSPPEAEKPMLPYKPGLVLHIRRHTPAPPFGSCCSSPGPRKEFSETDIRDMNCTQAQFCFRCLLTEPPQKSATPETQTLEIVRRIACEDGRGAQIVLCQVGSREQRMVAKIYDPLYYPYDGNTGGGGPVDATYYADMHYSREAAAYEMLRSQGVDGVFAPGYHGSWTFDWTMKPSVPDNNCRYLRPVRLILMDELKGIIIESLDKQQSLYRLTGSQKLDCLGQAIELDTKVRCHGVSHRAISPRHVLLLVNHDKKMVRRGLLDFSASVVCTHASNPKPVTSLQLLYRNLLELVSDGNYERLAAWLPKDFAAQPELFRHWARMRWYNCDLFSKTQEHKEKQEDEAHYRLLFQHVLSSKESSSVSDSPVTNPPSLPAPNGAPHFTTARFTCSAGPDTPSAAASPVTSTSVSVTNSATSAMAASATTSTAPSTVTVSPAPTHQPITPPAANQQALLPLNAADFTTCLACFRAMTSEALAEADFQLSLDNSKLQLRVTALRQSTEDYDADSNPAVTQRALATVVSSFTTGAGEGGFGTYLEQFGRMSKEALPEVGARLALENALLQMRIAALSMVQAERVVGALPPEKREGLAGFRRGTGVEVEVDPDGTEGEMEVEE
ncbi:hypothetical protein GE09DRAFT_1278616 [Coniochaeta sp. 2T2.1]|nr:hypothetical protein GE09DRAFT_1278616 [Coniochaeta sp. 2T2.1]